MEPPISSPSSNHGMPETPKSNFMNREQEKSFTGAQIAILVITFLVLAGGLSYYFWKKADNSSTGSQNATSTQQGSQNATSTSNGTDNATSTPPVVTSSSTNDGVQDVGSNLHNLGESAEFFLNDEVQYKDTEGKIHWKIAAIEFTDSRCAADVQCIWAGERGVKLRIDNLVTGQSAEVSLGTERMKVGNALGLTLTLNSIEDGKGGDYAEVNVR